MNCTAWNSVRANALTKSPNAIPRIALATASSTISTFECSRLEAEQAEADERDDGGLARPRPRRTRCRSRGAARASSSGVVRSRSSVPRRALAQHRDRGDEEHADQREEPEHRHSDALEHLLAAREELVDEDHQHARHDERAARACAGRAAAARAPAPPWPRCARGSSRRLALDEPQERRVEVGRAGAPQELVRRRGRRGSRPRGGAGAGRSAPPRPSRGSRRAASCRRRRARGRSPTGRGAAPGRGRRWARRARARRARRGAPSRARRAPSARPRAGRRAASAMSARPTRSITSSTRAARDAEHAREVGEVLAHREVGVDRRRLRHVADAAPQRRARRPGARARARRPPATICTPTIARISVDLPLPLGPSRPVTTPPSTVERERRGAPWPAAVDAQAA